jgi:hypothetical protein
MGDKGMIPFSLSKDISFELAQDYGELTFKQFFELRKPNLDKLTIMSIVSGLDRSILEQSKDIHLDEKMLMYLTFLQNVFNPNDFVLPDTLKIGDKVCKRPKDLASQCFGQKLALEKKYYELGNDLDTYPYALALYFQPIYFEQKYDADKVEELLPLIMECKLEEAYPIASFFLNNYSQSLNSKKRDWFMLLHRKRIERGLIDLRSSRNSARSTTSRNPLIKIMRKFYSWSTTSFSLLFGMKASNQAIKKS